MVCLYPESLTEYILVLNHHLFQLSPESDFTPISSCLLWYKSPISLDPSVGRAGRCQQWHHFWFYRFHSISSLGFRTRPAPICWITQSVSWPYGWIPPGWGKRWKKADPRAAGYPVCVWLEEFHLCQKIAVFLFHWFPFCFFYKRKEWKL